MSDFEEATVSVSIKRTINLGNFENVTIFMAASGIEPGATVEEIEELLVTGEKAFQLLSNRVGSKIRELKSARNETS